MFKFQQRQARAFPLDTTGSHKFSLVALTFFLRIVRKRAAAPPSRTPSEQTEQTEQTESNVRPVDVDRLMGWTRVRN